MTVATFGRAMTNQPLLQRLATLKRPAASPSLVPAEARRVTDLTPLDPSIALPAQPISMLLGPVARAEALNPTITPTDPDLIAIMQQAPGEQISHLLSLRERTDEKGLRERAFLVDRVRVIADDLVAQYDTHWERLDAGLNPEKMAPIERMHVDGLRRGLKQSLIALADNDVRLNDRELWHLVHLRELDIYRGLLRRMITTELTASEQASLDELRVLLYNVFSAQDELSPREALMFTGLRAVLEGSNTANITNSGGRDIPLDMLAAHEQVGALYSRVLNPPGSSGEAGGIRSSEAMRELFLQRILGRISDLSSAFHLVYNYDQEMAGNTSRNNGAVAHQVKTWAEKTRATGQDIPTGFEYRAYVAAHGGEAALISQVEKGLSQTLLGDKHWRRGARTWDSYARHEKTPNLFKHPMLSGNFAVIARPKQEPTVKTGSKNHGSIVFDKLNAQVDGALAMIGVEQRLLHFRDSRLDTGVFISLDSFDLEGNVLPNIVMGAIYASGAGTGHSDKRAMMTWMKADMRIRDRTGAQVKVYGHGESRDANVMRIAFDHAGQGIGPGQGPDVAKFRELQGERGYLNWIQSILQLYPAWLYPGLPRVFAGRSLGAQLGAELLYQDGRQYFDAVYMMGAWHTERDEAHALGYILDMGFEPNWPVLTMLARWGGILEKDFVGVLNEAGLRRRVDAVAHDPEASAAQSQRSEWSFQRVLDTRVPRMRAVAYDFVDPETGLSYTFDDLMEMSWLPHMMNALRHEKFSETFGGMLHAAGIKHTADEIPWLAQQHLADIESRGKKLIQDPVTLELLMPVDALQRWIAQVIPAVKFWERVQRYFRTLRDRAGIGEAPVRAVNFLGIQDQEYQWRQIQSEHHYAWQPAGREISLQEDQYVWQAMFAATGVPNFFNPWAGHDHRAQRRLRETDLPVARRRAELDPSDPEWGPFVPVMPGADQETADKDMARHIERISSHNVRRLLYDTLLDSRGAIDRRLEPYGMKLVI
jgi:hypothetical protein